LQLSQDQVIQVARVLLVANQDCSMFHGQITKVTRGRGGSHLEGLRAFLPFIEMRRFFRAAAVDVVEIQRRRPVIWSALRLEVRSLQWRGIIRQVMTKKLAEVGVTNSWRECAFPLDFVAHGSAQLY